VTGEISRLTAAFTCRMTAQPPAVTRGGAPARDRTPHSLLFFWQNSKCPIGWEVAEPVCIQGVDPDCAGIAMLAEMKIAQNAATPVFTPVQNAIQIPCKRVRRTRNLKLMTAFVGFP
jgi:hypothetical protein